MSRIATLLFSLCVLFSVLTQADEPPPRNTLVTPAQHVYLPTAAPDRIILTVTEDPTTSQSVNWRTAPGLAASEAQLTLAIAGAGLHLQARTVSGSSRVLPSDNGLAQHHQVRFDDLAPDTLYAYRVRGHGTWSEWFQFRTAGLGDDGFAFLYFGDAQNSVKSHFSRVIREARLELPRPAVMLHAGDLVSLREGNHDDEWGEWFDAGAFLYAMTPNIVVAGNHEHITVVHDDETETRLLSDHFRHQFRVPANGPPELADTVYATRYQNTLFVVLDSTAALEDEALAILQARWLDQLLAEDTSRWIIVSHHHPIHSVSLDRDNPLLREHWQPVYERHSVDLVLQGHDHTYGRGPNVAEGTTLIDSEIGTVYVVSVAGPKMYYVAENRALHRRVGEDVQLYQIIDVGEDRIAYQARTVIGEVYDAFDLVKQPGAPNRLVEKAAAAQAEAVCGNPDPPRETRCWEGIELVH